MKSVLKIIAVFIIFSTTMNAQSNFRINVMGDINSPTGDMGEFFEIGFGANAGISYKLSDSWDLGASFGYGKWNVENDYYSKLASDVIENSVDVEVDMPYTVIPVMLDVYYYFSREKFQPYLSLSLGVHFAKFETNSIEMTGEKVVFEKSESDTVAGYKFGCGVMYNFSPSIAINLAASMVGNALEIEQDSFDGSTPNKIATTYINIGLGVSISL